MCLLQRGHGRIIEQRRKGQENATNIHCPSLRCFVFNSPNMNLSQAGINRLFGISNDFHWPGLGDAKPRSEVQLVGTMMQATTPAFPMFRTAVRRAIQTRHELVPTAFSSSITPAALCHVEPGRHVRNWAWILHGFEGDHPARSPPVKRSNINGVGVQWAVA